MMGTRSGDLDPGVLFYFLQQKQLNALQLAELLNEQSGLLGVSDITSDMKMLLERRHSEPNAVMAVEMFCYQVRKRSAPSAPSSAGSIYWSLQAA